MLRIRLMRSTAALAAAFLFVVAHPAAAQNTVSQTTCGGVSGVDSCLTNGFLQDLTVNCANAHGTEVSTALAQITDRNGPNRITLSGGNCGGFSIVGFNVSRSWATARPWGDSGASSIRGTSRSSR